MFIEIRASETKDVKYGELLGELLDVCSGRGLKVKSIGLTSKDEIISQSTIEKKEIVIDAEEIVDESGGILLDEDIR